MLVQQVPVGDTNCYLLRAKNRAVVFDPGPARRAQAVIAATEGAGIRPEHVRLILISHGHLDHYGAAPAVQEWCAAPIAAYHSEPTLSQDRGYALPPAQTLQGSIVRWAYLLGTSLSQLPALDADLLLDDGTDLNEFGIPAQVLLVPGHTPGSLSVHTAEGDLLAGDLFVNYAVPSQPIYLADRDAWQSSYERIRGLQPRTVYVGHGDPFSGEKLDRIYPARYQLRWWIR